MSPTWGDIEAFLTADGWRQLAAGERGGPKQRHIFFEKLLPDGRVLQTHISHDRHNTLSPGRFGAILKDQLEVNRQECWEAIRTGQPVARPVDADEGEPVELPSCAVRVLTVQMHIGADQVARLTVEEATMLVHNFWSQARGWSP